MEYQSRSVVAAVAAIVFGGLITFLPVGPGVHEVRAAASVNLDQWATKDVAWQNGNLNGNNTQYPEGGIVPFRLAVEGLTAGNHTIRIQYDFTAGGHKAYDFLAYWNGWVSPPKCSASGGGISSMCPSMPAPSSAPFPSDHFVTDGLSVAGAEAYSGVSRRLTIWGGTVTSISGPVHTGPTTGNSSAEFTVHFHSTGPAVLLAWGGHLAQSRYWNLLAGGVRDGAGEVSGSPWHMRTLQLDGSGNRNQDRSIQPSAIVGELGPFALAPPTPTPRPTAPPNNNPGPGNPGPGNPGNPPGSNPGAPGVPGGPGGVPGVTVPPTTTLSDAVPPPSQGFLPAVIVGLLVTSFAALLGVRRAGRDRGRGRARGRRP
jgi:hypothetical protein